MLCNFGPCFMLEPLQTNYHDLGRINYIELLNRRKTKTILTRVVVLFIGQSLSMK